MPPASIEWSSVQRVLVVKLRSIGDTVLTTPSLIALRRSLPHAQIDILLEDWVAPVLDGFEDVDNVLAVEKTTAGQLRMARKLRRRHYDVVFNLHGGTTSTFYTAATRATHRIGLKNYQYSFLYTHAYPSPAEFWKSDQIHSAEQQLALLGFAGIPVEDRPGSSLAVTAAASASVARRLSHFFPDGTPFAMIHPAASSFTKQWAVEHFARTAEFLADQGLKTVAVASKNERAILDALTSASEVPVVFFDDLTLPEITALAASAKVFAGNDSGIAHFAAAVGTPAVVIFGSSNRVHWRPWTAAPYEVVYKPFHCQPCAGYVCAEFGQPRCILEISPQAVFESLRTVLKKSGRGKPALGVK